MAKIDQEARRLYGEPPGEDPLERLRHTLRMYDPDGYEDAGGAEDDAVLVTATSHVYVDTPWTGLTWGDLRAISRLLDSPKTVFEVVDAGGSRETEAIFATREAAERGVAKMGQDGLEIEETRVLGSGLTVAEGSSHWDQSNGVIFEPRPDGKARVVIKDSMQAQIVLQDPEAGKTIFVMDTPLRLLPGDSISWTYPADGIVVS